MAEQRRQDNVPLGKITQGGRRLSASQVAQQQVVARNVSAASGMQTWVSQIRDRPLPDGLDHFIKGVSNFLPSMRERAARIEQEKANQDRAQLIARAKADARLDSQQYENLLAVQKATQDGQIAVSDNPLYQQTYYSTLGEVYGLKEAQVYKQRFEEQSDNPDFNYEVFQKQEQTRMESMLKDSNPFFSNTYTASLVTSLREVDTQYRDSVNRRVRNSNANNYVELSHESFKSPKTKVVLGKDGKQYLEQETEETVLASLLTKAAESGVGYEDAMNGIVQGYLKSKLDKVSDDNNFKKVDLDLMTKTIKDENVINALKGFERGREILKKNPNGVTFGDLTAGLRGDKAKNHSFFLQQQVTLLAAENQKVKRQEALGEKILKKNSNTVKSRFFEQLRNDKFLMDSISKDNTLSAEEKEEYLNNAAKKLEAGKTELLDSLSLTDEDRTAVDLALHNEISNLRKNADSVLVDKHFYHISKNITMGEADHEPLVNYIEKEVEDVKTKIALMEKLKKDLGVNYNFEQYQEFLQTIRTNPTQEKLDEAIRDSNLPEPRRRELANKLEDALERKTLMDARKKEGKAEDFTKLQEKLKKDINWVFNNLVATSITFEPDPTQGMFGRFNMGTEAGGTESNFKKNARNAFTRDALRIIRNNPNLKTDTIETLGDKWGGVLRGYSNLISKAKTKGDKEAARKYLTDTSLPRVGWITFQDREPEKASFSLFREYEKRTAPVVGHNPILNSNEFKERIGKLRNGSNLLVYLNAVQRANPKDIRTTPTGIMYIKGHRDVAGTIEREYMKMKNEMLLQYRIYEDMLRSQNIHPGSIEYELMQEAFTPSSLSKKIHQETKSKKENE